MYDVVVSPQSILLNQIASLEAEIKYIDETIEKYQNSIIRNNERKVQCQQAIQLFKDAAQLLKDYQ